MVAPSPPSSAHSARPRRNAVLVVLDCDDELAMARLREIAPWMISLHSDERSCPPASIAMPTAPEDELTARQKDILAGVMRGLSNKEIGRELGISHFTVRNHVSRLLQHLAMPSRRHLRRVLAGSESLPRVPVAGPEALTASGFAPPSHTQLGA
jgi:DNA-binding NarL/FixJ family response regulator